MNRRYSRRQVVGSLTVGASTLVAGCSNGSTPDGESSANTTGEDGESAARVLRLSKSFSEESLDPILASWLPRWMGLQECLVSIDDDLKLVPSLATDWTTSDEGQTWRFTLRDDVTFHNGESMDAEAVRWSLRRAFSDATSFVSSVPVSSITTEGQYELGIELERPFVPLPAYLGHNSAAIVREQTDDDSSQFDPVFTGPFAVDSWQPEERLTAVRNEEYYGSIPGIDRVEFEVVLDGKTRELKLLNGELNMVWNQPITSVSAFESDSKAEVYLQQKTQTRCLAFNTESGPFAEKAVRKAANYALNEAANVENVLEGVGEVGVGPWPPSIYWAKDDLQSYEHAPKKATRLLEDTGWVMKDGTRHRDGTPLAVTLHTYPTRANFRTLAEAMQGQLESAGFDVELKLTDWATMLDAKERGEFDATMEARTTFAYPPDPENLASLYHSTDSYMDTGYANETVDGLLEQGRTTRGREERKELYDRVQSIVMEDLPISYQSYMTVVHGTRSAVQNFEPTHPVGNEFKLAGVSVSPDE